MTFVLVFPSPFFLKIIKSRDIRGPPRRTNAETESKWSRVFALRWRQVCLPPSLSLPLRSTLSAARFSVLLVHFLSVDRFSPLPKTHRQNIRMQGETRMRLKMIRSCCLLHLLVFQVLLGRLFLKGTAKYCSLSYIHQGLRLAGDTSLTRPWFANECI